MYSRTFVTFGNNWSDATKDFIIKDPILETFNIWTMNRWTHLGFAFEKTTGHVSLVKVIFLSPMLKKKTIRKG